MSRAFVIAFVSSWLISAPGVRAQSHGFGSHPPVAPLVGTQARPTTLRLIPRSATAAAPAIGLVRVSAGIDGAQANGLSFQPSLSAGGRYVVFGSAASNLVAGDTNDLTDIFVYDRSTGQMTRENLGPGGAQANANSLAPSISATGRYVVFESVATNLVPGVDGSFNVHIYVRDRQLGVTTLADVSTAGVLTAFSSYDPAISGDGRYVAFSTSSPNLVSGDTNGCPDVFTHDTVMGTTERVSVSSTAAEAPCSLGSFRPALSADGRYVAFDSDANLVAATGGRRAVFVRDRLTGLTTVESVGSDGVPLPDSASAASISADGRFVSFHVSRFVPGAGVQERIYLHDRATGQTAGPVVGVFVTHMSADGRFVTYANLDHQAFAFDRIAATFIAIANDVLEISAVAGGAVAFSSSVAQLPADTNGVADIYVATAADPGAPGVPRDLAPSLFGSTLTLTWNPPVSGGAPTAYIIEAGSTNGGTEAANFSTGSTATSFSATVTGGGTFYIRIRATNAAGTSPPSNQILVTIGSALAPPGAPIGLGATVTGSMVTLMWARPLSGGSATEYIVEAGSSSGSSNLASINTGTSATSFVAAGVASGSYYVRVRGSNTGGTGPPSNEILVVIR